MSAILESVLSPETRTECARNDLAVAKGYAIGDYGRHTTNFRLQFARTAGEGFRDASYAQAFEHHLKPGLWARLRRAWRRLIR